MLRGNLHGDGVKSGAATLAILTTRLFMERRELLLSASACALLAYLQRYDAAALQLAGTLIFGTLIGVAAALIQRGSGRFAQIELCELSAPLYGRELARATALVPCIIVSAALCVYWVVAAVYGTPDPASVILSFSVVNVVTVVALRATLARGARRAAWIAAACALAGAGYLISKAPIAFAIGACCIAGFAALRQYGEALARYDPLDGLSGGRGGELL